MAEVKPAGRRPAAVPKAASKAGTSKHIKVTKEDVMKVASVGRLKLTDKEAAKFSGELEKILDAFRELEAIDTTNINPSFQPVKLENVTREDAVKPSLPQSEALMNAKNREGGFVKGPKVI
jgi:aspartyl-tRNA(Asn)/glutamyl-tRNA(Gln) amidotransferase subunit C